MDRKLNEPLNAVTEEGNAAVTGEGNCMEEIIVEGLKTPLHECLTEDEVSW